MWSRLQTLEPKVALEAGEPRRAEFAEYRADRELAARFLERPLEPAATGRRAAELPACQMASLVRMFRLVPGECGYAKLEALAAVFRCVPRGDIVEIGSLFGRSAVALAYLARHYRTGRLLCVDPWKREETLQGIPIVDTLSIELDIDEVFGAFCVNLAPFSGLVNYLRLRSTDGARIYRSQEPVCSEEFGKTPYTGRIALLHIDGNHALDAVRADIAAWSRYVRPRGWIVLDDYVWPFGDGPKVAAEEFLREQTASLATAFVAGGALFIQLASSDATRSTSGTVSPRKCGRPSTR